MPQNSLTLVRTGDQVLDRNFDAIKQMFRAIVQLLCTVSAQPPLDAVTSSVGALTGIVVGQLLTPPTGANIVVLSGGETIKGIDKRPWAGTFGRLLLYFQNGGHLLNNVSTGDSNFSSIVMGNFGGLSTTPGSGQADKLDFGDGGLVELLLIANGWNMISMPNTGQV
jgi:hypothetical protein